MHGWTPWWSRMSISPKAFSHADRTASPARQHKCQDVAFATTVKRLEKKQHHWAKLGHNDRVYLYYFCNSANLNRIFTSRPSQWDKTSRFDLCQKNVCPDFFFFKCSNPWQSLLTDFSASQRIGEKGNRDWIPQATEHLPVCPSGCCTKPILRKYFDTDVAAAHSPMVSMAATMVITERL